MDNDHRYIDFDTYSIFTLMFWNHIYSMSLKPTYPILDIVYFLPVYTFHIKGTYLFDLYKVIIKIQHQH